MAFNFSSYGSLPVYFGAEAANNGVNDAVAYIDGAADLVDELQSHERGQVVLEEASQVPQSVRRQQQHECQHHQKHQPRHLNRRTISQSKTTSRTMELQKFKPMVDNPFQNSGVS